MSPPKIHAHSEPGNLERNLLVGFGITALAFLTGFILIFYVAFPDVFGETSRRVFMPLLCSYDIVFLAATIAALRGRNAIARTILSAVTSVVVYVSFLQTGGFPSSPITTLALIPPMLFVTFHGARAGLAFSAIFVVMLMAQWYGSASMGIKFPNFSESNPLVAFVVFLSAAFVMISFFAIVEAENRRLRRSLSLERDNFAMLAQTDALTGLHNARSFNDSVDLLIDRHAKATPPFAAIFIDLDEFKPINDRFGHIVGDKVLIAVANRLREVVGSAGISARIGGDEFAVLLGQAPQHLEAVCDTIRNAIEQPMAIGSIALRVGASIGYALQNHDGTDRRALLHAADSRMYADKLRRTARRMGGKDASSSLETATDGLAAA